MGLIEGVKAVLGDVVAATERTYERVGSGRIALAFAKFHPGGLAAFLDGLRAAGHGEVADSWLAAGSSVDTRRPVPVEAVAACLPASVAARIAYDLSIPEGRVATALAEFLPAAVAGVSADGRLTPQPNYSTQHT